ncbi:NIPSNAP family protein [Novosphingobium sp. BL-8H]|uniref:NIPSNAP family protein n=1 Tax=Novosphingobium sp. BL-8H TaxID=3127640 RepID=UPI003757EBCD
MFFEVATLKGSVFAGKGALPGARAWVEDAVAGTLLGMWQTEIGPIGQLMLLRSFDTLEELRTERHRALMSDDPFGTAAANVKLSLESFAPFPFLPPPKPRAYGGVFEWRTYWLTPGGLPGTLDGWRMAIEPARAYTDHLVTAMYALDGEPRITHLWGFGSVEQRNRLRREHYSVGLWPPKGGPERIEHATSTIAFAEPDFPIC